MQICILMLLMQRQSCMERRTHSTLPSLVSRVLCSLLLIAGLTADECRFYAIIIHTDHDDVSRLRDIKCSSRWEILGLRCIHTQPAVSQKLACLRHVHLATNKDRCTLCMKIHHRILKPANLHTLP